MNINKININQSKQTYNIASDIYDVTANNNDTTFSSLSELLSAENLSTLIPTAVRCGGMTIRFIQSSDNKYVQYRLMTTSFSIIEDDWLDAAIIGTDRIADEAVTTSKLGAVLLSKLEDVNTTSTSYEDKITISDDNDNIVADINSEFSDFKNLKSNGKDVLTEVNTKDIIDNAITTDKLGAGLQSKLEDVNSVTFSNYEDKITITDDNNNIVADINSEYSDFKNLKSNGKDVLTNSLDIQCEELNVYDEKITISDDNDNIIADINSEYSDFKNLKSNGKDVLTGKMISEHSIGTVSHLGLINMATPSDFDYSLMVIYGQSLAQGGAAQGSLSTQAIEGNYTLSSGINTSGSLDYSVKTLVPLKVEEKSQEHPVCGFVNAYSALHRRYKDKNAKFIGLAGGYSGAQIEYINKGTTYYNNFIAACTRIKDIADSENKTVGCVGILFMQGESNYIPNSGVAEQSKSGYKDLMRKLKEDLQNDLSSIFQQEHKPIFLMYQTGYKWIRNNHWDCSMSQAQLEISQEIDDIILVNPTYQLTINSSQHPNYNGYRWFGEQAAKALWMAINYGLKYETVRPVSIYVAETNKIVVSVYAPVFPIRVDTWTNNQIKDYGFDVKLNGSICEITSVNVDGTKIIVETKEDLSNGIVEISYAGLNRQGQGNICDSDTWKSLTNYMNDLDDSEWNTDNYKYPVVKRPLDINGNYIFDKPYPMQNWMSNFYYNLSFYFKSNLVECSIGDTVKNDLVNTCDLQGISFSSSNETVASVSDSGELTLNAEGSCFITAEATRDDVTYKADYLLILKSNIVKI